MDICKVLGGGNLLHSLMTWYQPAPRGVLQMAAAPALAPEAAAAAEAGAPPVLFQGRSGGLWDSCMVLAVI